jgi:molybdopterin synthase catalytic subunit
VNRIRIKLFATLRERAGVAELEHELQPGADLASIWTELVREFPRLKGNRDAIAYAVNEQYVEAGYRPRDGDEVAFIPPVSGGMAVSSSIGPITIVRTEINVAQLERVVSDPGAGAIVTFTGSTRAENAGREVIRLEYEAYEPMALKEMRKLAEEAYRRFGLKRIAICHRIGVVEIGQISVAIAVSAAHRGEAFEACRFAIDRLKQIVPIWKKEHFKGGEIWVGCQTSHPGSVLH